jgi:hypothetical protein
LYAVLTEVPKVRQVLTHQSAICLGVGIPRCIHLSMSLSASGTVILGVTLPEGFLQFKGALERVCPKDRKHAITDKPYCPCCGHAVMDQHKWEPSTTLILYADKAKISVGEALKRLSAYTYLAPRQGYIVFGIELTNAGTNKADTCSLDRLREEATRLEPLLTDLGLDPNNLALHLFVEIH